MQYHKKKRNIQSGDKYQRRYPMSGMLVCPHCGKSLRRRYVYNKRVEWICSTYIQKGKEACKGIRVRDELLTGLSFTEPMVVEEVFENGEKYYGYTSKRAYDSGERAADRVKEESRSVLPRLNRSTFTKLFILSWNDIAEHQADYQVHWQENIKGGDILLRYKTRLLMKYAAAGPIKEFDSELMMAVMDHITVFEDGRLQIRFYDVTEFEFATE